MSERDGRVDGVRERENISGDLMIRSFFFAASTEPVEEEEEDGEKLKKKAFSSNILMNSLKVWVTGGGRLGESFCKFSKQWMTQEKGFPRYLDIRKAEENCFFSLSAVLLHKYILKERH